jgi:hypothetical protein
VTQSVATLYIADDLKVFKTSLIVFTNIAK